MMVWLGGLGYVTNKMTMLADIADFQLIFSLEKPFRELNGREYSLLQLYYMKRFLRRVVSYPVI